MEVIATSLNQVSSPKALCLKAQKRTSSTYSNTFLQLTVLDSFTLRENIKLLATIVENLTHEDTASFG